MNGVEAAGLVTVRLPAKTRIYENAGSAAGGLLFVVLGWLVAYPLLPSPWGFRIALGMTVVAVVGVSVDLVMNEFQQRHFTLQVVPRGMEIRRGRYITTTVSLIPGAVLSADVHSGPLLRRLGLARLRLNGIAQFPEIPPLAQDDARVVQSLMVEQLRICSVSSDDGGEPWSS